MQNKTVITIIFYGKFWSCNRAYRDVSLERPPIWEYPKIGPWFEIMMSVDADLRSGRRFEPGCRSESIILNISKIKVFHHQNLPSGNKSTSDVSILSSGNRWPLTFAPCECDISAVLYFPNVCRLFDLKLKKMKNNT